MKERDFRIDNIKGLLIFFVILGHIVLKIRSVPLWGGVINVIYSFHMPAFILISGYLSKHIDTYRKKELDTLLWPFAVFQVLYMLFAFFTPYYSFSPNFFSPIYLTWYILALFLWRLVLPYFRFMNKYIVILILLTLSAYSGAVLTNSVFSLYRVFYYFPIFALGYYIKDLDSFYLKVRPWRYVFICTFIVGVVSILGLSYFGPQYNNWLNYALTPDSGYNRDLHNIPIRMIGFVITTIMTICFIVVCYSLKILNKPIPLLSKSGKNSVSVYFLHGFIALIASYYIIRFDNIVITIISLLLTILMMWLFSRDSVVKLLGPFFNLGKLSKK